MIAGDPHQGGATWAVLQYVLGLRDLGHEVYLVEPIAPSSICPSGASLQDSVNARYFQDVASQFDLSRCAALLRQDTLETVGMPYSALIDAAAECDLLLNVSGMLTDPDLLDRIPRRVYLDLDPAFNQLWHSSEGIDMRFDAHTHFVTVGLAIGSPECVVPTCGVTWHHTLQPVVLPEWSASAGDPSIPWTTIGNWRAYGSIQHDGVFYGQKAHSLRRFMNLPTGTDVRFQLAMAIDPGEVKDLQALEAGKWDLVDPAVVAGTPDDYRRFIQGSTGELGIAKSGYVDSQCGWFSDRSACYLASGRPVVAQDTGFSRFLPTGWGLFAFTTVEEALDGIEAVGLDYATHRQAARAIAEEYFRSDRVLNRLLDSVGCS